ncbi:tRNA synthetase class I (I, L, M and V) family protein [Actinidia rufa]|uniref:tRNA synthetase class I (I, L, M and V) family protein n=1 Tax=Actinidia rufa TaxID=165716 RepID=A0A7J0GTA1_9ERIC|nr:tRNA synthetase class I (I, L, M and V) family protein [Actinidia rufa]
MSLRTCSSFRKTTSISLLCFRRSSSVKVLSLLNVAFYSTSSSDEFYSSSKRRSRGPVMAAKKASEGAKQEEGKYKHTVDLPKTTFGMRANSAVREPEIQKLWEENQVFKRVSDRNNGGSFVLHDGPPYANVLQSLDNDSRKELTPLKLRTKAAKFAKATVKTQMASFKRFGVWGDWDHPYLTLDPEYEAAQVATTAFLKFLFWGFLKLNINSQVLVKMQIEVFGEMAFRGYIYRGRKPVHWSPSSRTALAEAELELTVIEEVGTHCLLPVQVLIYLVQIGKKRREVLEHMLTRKLIAAFSVCLKPSGLFSLPTNETKPLIMQWKVQNKPDVVVEVSQGTTSVLHVVVKSKYGLQYPEGHVSKSILLSVSAPSTSSGLLGEFFPDLSLAIWTTTPWTIPANAAVAVNPKLQYVVVEVHALFEDVSTTPGDIKKRYIHPIDSRECPVVLGGDYITTESGTGLVHTAPGHGQEDYVTGLKYGLPILSPVDDDGKFTEEAGRFSGLDVLGDGNVAVIESLDEHLSLIMVEPYKHKYPYDWRERRKPTIFRATEQWFASVEGFREAAMDAISQVTWTPPQVLHPLLPPSHATPRTW